MIRAALMKLARHRATQHERRCLAFASRTPIADEVKIGWVDSTLLRLVMFRRMTDR